MFAGKKFWNELSVNDSWQKYIPPQYSKWLQWLCCINYARSTIWSFLTHTRGLSSSYKISVFVIFQDLVGVRNDSLVHIYSSTSDLLTIQITLMWGTYLGEY